MVHKLSSQPRTAGDGFNGHELVTEVVNGVKFEDGIKATDDNDKEMTPERVAA